ncbi:MAG TPA: bifunctional 5,10-methylene-tetrahydrofolate dehydrogenase/5,10-methylene-tetrahydrofolate cyclohydrolase [Candidatus Omnitrophica bacterium]|nr:bifunctional 5,10-methylene-tetrahydrofolate dehydrogenase/5,10-methylene-tetrahydrofolate cyclohydrolase [Candidatus Omnitrophota bacterium]
MAILLDGKNVAQSIKDGLRRDVLSLKKEGRGAPVLACVAVGKDPASAVYIRSQDAAARDLGIEYRLISFGEDITQEGLVSEIRGLNTDKGIHAVMIQSPLPKHLDIGKLVGFILPAKDAEGIHPENLGRLFLGQGKIAPPTAAACMELLRHSGVKLFGKEAVVVGHSNIVGKPLSLMLLKEFATTTVCHIATSEAGKLRDHVARAEILIVAVGQAQLVKGSWIKEGAVVLDVGINRAGGRIVGDVEFDEAQKRAAYITPVPGGVGPLTVTMLMRNTVELFKG